MSTLIHQRIEAARAGTNPAVICKLPSGWAVLSDSQFLHGYTILLADPVVADLNALDLEGRSRFLLDMSILGDALLEVTGAYRINYEILGNTDAVLHAHILPRYLAEPDDLRRGPAWFYPADVRAAAKLDLVRDSDLMRQVAAAVQKRL
jgi:diadenosine tetraphosphate (Ap4A) HIT family hydrolase